MLTVIVSHFLLAYKIYILLNIWFINIYDWKFCKFFGWFHNKIIYWYEIIVINKRKLTSNEWVEVRNAKITKSSIMHYTKPHLKYMIFIFAIKLCSVYRS
jgi:hypothetical protein